jgi:hypothetical protein
LTNDKYIENIKKALTRTIDLIRDDDKTKQVLIDLMKIFIIPMIKDNNQKILFANLLDEKSSNILDIIKQYIDPILDSISF